jgi:hypothetical protein
MAVWFGLNSSAERIGDVVIRRVEPLDLADPAAIQDVVSTYEVSRDGLLVGTVKHRYGDKAYRLVSLATALIAEEDA